MKTLADIKKIAVLGAGTMGPGIAQTYAMGGYTVTMWTRSESTREKAKTALKTQLETFAEEGEIEAAARKESIEELISKAVSFENDDSDRSDLIGEGLPENRPLLDRFLEEGFTYFDTAWAYGGSEDAIRQALIERYPRESYTLATKLIVMGDNVDEASAKQEFETDRKSVV